MGSLRQGYHGGEVNSMVRDFRGMAGAVAIPNLEITDRGRLPSRRVFGWPW